MSRFTELVFGRREPLRMPLLTYPGAQLVNSTVRDLVTSPEKQVEAQLALHEHFQTEVLLTSMDLSAEIEAFGGTVSITDWEVPSVAQRVVTDEAGAHALALPRPGAARTRVYLEAARLLKCAIPNAVVLGGMIGPFSLAARLFGVSEALELTVINPDLLVLLLQKSTEFLTAYALAFKEAGADGVIVAEPTAGLLSPRSMRIFSTTWARQIVEQVDSPEFTFVYHSCSVKLIHLDAVLECGAKVFHFGPPMDIGAALDRVGSDVVICGNLDPTNVFFRSPPTEIAAAVDRLLRVAEGHSNFVLSSGCDIPPLTPMPHIEAFFRGGQGRG